MIKKSNRPALWLCLWLFNILTCSVLYFKVVTRSQTSEKLLWDASTSRILLPKDSSLYSTQSIHTYHQTAYHPLMTLFFSFFLSNLIHHFVCLLVHSKLLFTFFLYNIIVCKDENTCRRKTKWLRWCHKNTLWNFKI